MRIRISKNQNIVEALKTVIQLFNGIEEDGPVLESDAIIELNFNAQKGQTSWMQVKELFIGNQTDEEMFERNKQMAIDECNKRASREILRLEASIYSVNMKIDKAKKHLALARQKRRTTQAQWVNKIEKLQHEKEFEVPVLRELANNLIRCRDNGLIEWQVAAGKSELGKDIIYVRCILDKNCETLERPIYFYGDGFTLEDKAYEEWYAYTIDTEAYSVS